MTLPDSPNTIYTTDAPVKSNDLVEIQESIAAAAHGAVVDNYWAGAARLTAASINASGAAEWSGAGIAQLPISARVGDVLTGGTFWARGNGAGTADFTAIKLWRLQADGTLDSMGDTPASNLPNSWASYPITLTAPVTVAAGDSFFVEWAANASGLQLATAAINRRHPLP